MKIFIVFAAFVAVSCSSPKSQSTETVTRQDAIGLAKAELARRVDPIPKSCVITVVASSIVEELKPEKAVFVVSFLDPTHSSNTPTYKVFINRKSGDVEAVLDLRVLIPAGTQTRP